MLRDSARRFLEGQRGWQAQAHAAANAGDYVDMGWPGMGLPEELGGIGADISQCLLVLEESGRVLLADWLATDIAVAAGLAHYGSVDGVAEVLGGLAEGRTRLALVQPAPRAGTLACASGGHDFTSGLVPGIDGATHWIVCIEAPEPLVVLVEPARIKNCQTASRVLMDGRQAAIASFAPASLQDGIKLADGQKALELQQLLRHLAIAGLVAECIGALDAGFALAVDYLKTRKQFGQPLSSFQAVQHLMADAYCDRENLRSLAIAMSAALEGPADQRRRAVSAAKAYLGRNGLAAASRCIQVTGGIAMTQEYFIGHVYKRLQTAAALYGSTEAHLSALV